ncbi:MAG TPA: hypothetical protein VEY31_01480, partial [Roseococcus sp.]|nr:hypothetical protein [Roseococcus sp.]
DRPLSAEQAAGWLAEAWESGSPLAPLPPELAPTDREAGEAMAAALVAALGIPVCGVRMLPGPLVGGRRAMISAPLLEPRMLRAGTPVALATLRHATLSAGVLGVLAEALGAEEKQPPVFASLHPVLDISAWRFRDVPGDAGAAVADLAGLGYVLVGKRSLMPLPGQAEVRLGQTGSRPRAIQENLGALMDEAASEARRWGGLPAGAALVVAGLGGMMPVQAGPVQAGPMQGEGEQPARKYSAAVAGVGRISAILS